MPVRMGRPLAHLSLEFERRPNNNDLSVVNVVEMAREPLSAIEPRLMMLGFEEVPDIAPQPMTGHIEPTASASPTKLPKPAGGQLAVCELLAERLRNTCHHPDLLVCLTSNYELATESRAALSACKAFANLQAAKCCCV